MHNVREELDKFRAIGIQQPTLRAMCYRLYSLGKINNTKTDFGMLSDKTAVAREQRSKYYGFLAINCFADESRGAYYHDSQLDHKEPKDLAKEWVDKLRKLANNYKDKNIERWLDQKHYVAIWTEKKAMVSTFESILGNREVDIVPFGGQPSVSFMWDVCEKLKELKKLKKQIHILYFGDLDPTGENIEVTIKRKLSRYGLSGIDFKRIGLTKQQVDDLKLPTDPDPDTLEKLENDSNRHQFRAKYGKLFQVEVDALVAYDAQGFTDLVRQSVDKYFDKKIHKKVLKKYSSKSIGKDVNELLKQQFPGLCDDQGQAPGP